MSDAALLHALPGHVAIWANRAPEIELLPMFNYHAPGHVSDDKALYPAKLNNEDSEYSKVHFVPNCTSGNNAQPKTMRRFRVVIFRGGFKASGLVSET